MPEWGAAGEFEKAEGEDIIPHYSIYITRGLVHPAVYDAERNRAVKAYREAYAGDLLDAVEAAMQALVERNEKLSAQHAALLAHGRYGDERATSEAMSAVCMLADALENNLKLYTQHQNMHGR